MINRDIDNNNNNNNNTRDDSNEKRACFIIKYGCIKKGCII